MEDSCFFCLTPVNIKISLASDIHHVFPGVSAEANTKVFVRKLSMIVYSVIS